MNLHSIHQDLEIEYYAMMSRIVQFARKNTVKNTVALEIPDQSSKKINMLLATTSSINKKILKEVATA